MDNPSLTDTRNTPVIIVLSGGAGASGLQLVNTALAQFPGSQVQIILIANVRQPAQVTQAVHQAQAAGALVVHTLVDAHLRTQLEAEAGALGVTAVDLMGSVLGWLAGALQQPPLQEPGLYRMLHREYFDRVSAIEYTLKHDDGKHPEGWSQAEIMVVGVSRSGKTPLSIYLAVLGWKVANYPLVPEIPAPQELFSLDPRRVFGLTIDSEQLLVYRRQRQARLGVTGQSLYTDLEAIQAELRVAQRLYRQGGFQTLNMTDKTIEQGADEILRKLNGGESQDNLTA